ncbi:MAG: deoxyhypusine synthase family protein [Pirellulales bacterium]|nr:deoxyhypusine synthase family protein [Pirellulales bacterium]
MTRELHDGREDGLEPLESLDVRRAEGFADMLRRMSRTAFGGRELGEAFEVLEAMANDPQCLIVVTLSGAMTVAKMGRLLCDMIDENLAHVVVSTGAIMAHGLSEAVGGTHFKHDPRIPDSKLYKWGYNRVYDTVELEANLLRGEEYVSGVLGDWDPQRPMCSWELNREVGRRLHDEGQMPSVLGCAYRRNVPVYVPAFTDSDIGLGVSSEFLVRKNATGRKKDMEEFFAAVPPYNPFLDLHDYTRRILAAKRLGIFTIGGGVPRNWAQQVGPFIDILNTRVETKLSAPRFQYAVRICPEPVHWGGLSGCTYTEGVSWGKFVSRAEGGRFAEVHCDATIAWPLLIRAILETKGKAEGEEKREERREKREERRGKAER